jgi:hypothetical protein
MYLIGFMPAPVLDLTCQPAGPDHAQIASVNGVMDYMEAVAGPARLR